MGLLSRDIRSDPNTVVDLSSICRAVQEFLEYGFAFGPKANPLPALRALQPEGQWRYVAVGEGKSAGELTKSDLSMSQDRFKSFDVAYMWAVHNGFVTFNRQRCRDATFIQLEIQPDPIGSVTPIFAQKILSRNRMIALRQIFDDSSGTFGFGSPRWLIV